VTDNVVSVFVLNESAYFTPWTLVSCIEIILDRFLEKNLSPFILLEWDFLYTIVLSISFGFSMIEILRRLFKYGFIV